MAKQDLPLMLTVKEMYTPAVGLQTAFQWESRLLLNMTRMAIHFGKNDTITV